MAKRCTASPIGVHAMGSDSDASKVYRVEIMEVPGKGVVGVCDCIAYAISRNRAGGKLAGNFAECKHVKRKLAEGGCGWTSETGAPQQYPDICPLCSSATVEFNAVLTELVDVDEVIARLKALRKVAAS